MTSENPHNEKIRLKVKPSLPNGWQICRSSTYPDTIYYFNINTGCSTWELPGLVGKQHNETTNMKQRSQTTSKVIRSDVAHKLHDKSKEKITLKNINIEQPWHVKHPNENSLRNYPEPLGKPPGVTVYNNPPENEFDNCNVDVPSEEVISNYKSDNLIVVTNVAQGDEEVENYEANSHLWRRSTNLSLNTRFKFLNNAAEFTTNPLVEEHEDITSYGSDVVDSLEPNDLRLLLRAKRVEVADLEQFEVDESGEVEGEEYQNMKEDEAILEHDIQGTDEEQTDKEGEEAIADDSQNTTTSQKRVSFDSNTKMDSIEDRNSDWEDGFNSDCSDSTSLPFLNLDKLATLSLDGMGSRNLDLNLHWYIMVDSNVWLSNLALVKMLFSAKEGTRCAATILVPWRVLHELDSLGKTEQDARPMSASSSSWRHKRARRAKAFINANIRPTSCVDSRLVGESCQEANQKVFPCTGNDDEIINCCLKYAANNHHVIVLSNDKNLCNKALVNNIHAFTVSQMKELLYDNREQDSFDSANSPINMDKIHLSQFKRTISMCGKKEAINIVQPSIKSNPTNTSGSVQNAEQKHAINKKWTNLQKTLPNTKDQDNCEEKKKMPLIKNNLLQVQSEEPKTKKIILKRKRTQDLLAGNNNKRVKIQFDNPGKQNDNQDLVRKEGITNNKEIISTVKKKFINKNSNVPKSNTSVVKNCESTLNESYVNEQKTELLDKVSKPIKITFNMSFEELMKKKKDNLKKNFENQQLTLEKNKVVENEKLKLLPQTVSIMLPTESYAAFMEKNLNKITLEKNKVVENENEKLKLLPQTINRTLPNESYVALMEKKLNKIILEKNKVGQNENEKPKLLPQTVNRTLPNESYVSLREKKLNKIILEKNKVGQNENEKPKLLPQTVNIMLPTESYAAFMEKKVNKTLNIQKRSEISESLVSQSSTTESDDISSNITESISSFDDIPKLDGVRTNKGINSKSVTITELQKQNLSNKIVLKEAIFKIPQDIPQRKKISVASKEAQNQRTAVKLTVDETSIKSINKLPLKKERQKIVFDIDVPKTIEKPVQRVQPVVPGKKERVKIVYDLDNKDTDPKNECRIKQNVLAKHDPFSLVTLNKSKTKIQLNVDNKFPNTNNKIATRKHVTFNVSTISPNKKLLDHDNNINQDKMSNSPKETVNNVSQNTIFNSNNLNFVNKSNVRPSLRTNVKTKLGSANESMSPRKNLTNLNVQSPQAFTNNANLLLPNNGQKNKQFVVPFNTNAQCNNRLFKFTETSNKNVNSTQINSMQNLGADGMKGLNKFVETVNNVPQNIIFNSDSLNFVNKSTVQPFFPANVKMTFDSTNKTTPPMKSLTDWNVQNQQAFTNNFNVAIDNEVFELTETSNKNVDSIRVNSVQKLRTDMMKGMNRLKEDDIKVQPKMLRFTLSSHSMKKRIEGKFEEWICRLRQIMENLLSLELDRNLHLTPNRGLDMKPPWSLHEALVNLNMVFKDTGPSSSTSSSQSWPMETVVDALAQKVNEWLDQKMSRVTADDYMIMYSHSYNILYYLKSKHASEDDYTIALESLELIMKDIQNPDTDEDYNFAAHPEDITPPINDEPPQFMQNNKKDYNPLFEVKQYLKKHFPNAILDEDLNDCNQESCMENESVIAENIAANIIQDEKKKVDEVYQNDLNTQNVLQTDPKKSVETDDLDALNYEPEVSSEEQADDELEHSNGSVDGATKNKASINLSTEHTSEPVSGHQRLKDQKVEEGLNREPVNLDDIVHSNNFHSNRNSDTIIDVDVSKNDTARDVEKNVLEALKLAFLYSYTYCTKYSESLGARFPKSTKQSQNCLLGVADCNVVQIKKLSDAIGILLSRFHLILDSSSDITNVKAYNNLARTINDLLQIGNFKNNILNGADLKKCFDTRKNIMVACEQQFQSLHSALLILGKMDKS